MEDSANLLTVWLLNSAPVAQLVEQSAFNRSVLGSSPSGGIRKEYIMITNPDCPVCRGTGVDTRGPMAEECDTCK